MGSLSVSAVYVLIVFTAVSASGSPVSVYESPADLAEHERIDELVFGRLRQLGIQPAKLCSDAVFVRRVYLDVIGTLPTAKEAKEFLSDQKTDKRRELIDHLLQREEFADYWAMKWGDLLRLKAEFPVNLWPNAAQSYHRWIRASLHENLPYDRFVREMLTANGSNFRVGQVNFYRAVQSKTPEGIAQAVALTFMGSRAESWPKDQLVGMAAFFSQIAYKSTGEWKEEIVSFDPDKPVPKNATFPDGTPASLAVGQDPRAVVADWLITPDNPWFQRNIVNRIWFWLLGRGVIHESDDIRPDNPPSNPELLAYLEKELVRSKYDVKHIYRTILNSTIYQLSSIPRSNHPQAAVHFAHYPLRRLEAEVLIDALNQITGTTEQYSSPIPEPFTFIPEGQRSIALPDGSITSAFLEQFGRPSRDTGLESERSSRPTADQRLHMLNSSHIQRKLEDGPKLRALLQSAAPGPARQPGRFQKPRAKRAAEAARPRDILDEIYLTILSRRPTDQELSVVAEHMQSAPSKRDAVIDVAWALINSAEFLYRH